MTQGYHTYHLCGDRSITSELRDGFYRKQYFEVPPEHLRNKMMEIADIMNVQDPYFVSVMTNDQNDVFTYRVEVLTALTSKHLLEFQKHGFEFDEIIPRSEMVVLYLTDMKIDEL